MKQAHWEVFITIHKYPTNGCYYQLNHSNFFFWFCLLYQAGEFWTWKLIKVKILAFSIHDNKVSREGVDSGIIFSLKLSVQRGGRCWHHIFMEMNFGFVSSAWKRRFDLIDKHPPSGGALKAWPWVTTESVFSDVSQCFFGINDAKVLDGSHIRYQDREVLET